VEKRQNHAFYKLVEGKGNIELTAVKLYTGRTHQIRVHLSSIGRHILGDVLYGFKSKQDTINRVLLHAYKLYLNSSNKKNKIGSFVGNHFFSGLLGKRFILIPPNFLHSKGRRVSLGGKEFGPN